MLLLELEKARNPDAFIKKFLALFLCNVCLAASALTKNGAQQQIWDFLNFSVFPPSKTVAN